LYKAVTNASFQLDGKMPNCKLFWKSADKGVDRLLAHSFKILLLIWSGPEAFYVSSWSKIFLTKRGVIST